MSRHTGPAAAQLDQAMQHIAKSHNDRDARRQIGRTDQLVKDADSGEAVARYAYRLDCGHIITIWLQPLPEGTRHTYCEHHNKQVLVVEHLTD